MHSCRSCGNGVTPTQRLQADVLAQELHARYGDRDKEQLEAETERFSLAGRMMSRRVMGKASFAHIQDMSGRIQLFVRRDDLAQDSYAQFRTWDIGDLIAVTGSVFRTRTGELSIQADSIRLLAKSLRPCRRNSTACPTRKPVTASAT